MVRYAYRVRRRDKTVHVGRDTRAPAQDAPVTVEPPLPAVAQKVDITSGTVADVVVPTGREDVSGLSKAKLVDRAQATGVDASGTKADIAARLGQE